MPDLAWLRGAYAMMGQMGVVPPVVHRSHIRRRALGGAQGGSKTQRAAFEKKSAARSLHQQCWHKDSNHWLYSAHITFTAWESTVGRALKRARQRGAVEEPL